jgi:hypothetical protein
MITCINCLRLNEVYFRCIILLNSIEILNLIFQTKIGFYLYIRGILLFILQSTA